MKLFEKLLILLLLVGMACQRPLTHPNDLIPATGYRQVVRGVDQFDDFRDPRWRPFYKMGDEKIMGVIYVLVGGDGSVCSVPLYVWSLKPIGVPVACEWRIRHSVNRPEPIFRT